MEMHSGRLKNTGKDFVLLTQFVIQKTASALCWNLNNGGKVDKLGRLGANEIRFLNFITSIYIAVMTFKSSQM